MSMQTTMTSSAKKHLAGYLPWLSSEDRTKGYVLMGVVLLVLVVACVLCIVLGRYFALQHALPGALSGTVLWGSPTMIPGIGRPMVPSSVILNFPPNHHAFKGTAHITVGLLGQSSSSSLFVNTGDMSRYEVRGPHVPLHDILVPRAIEVQVTLTYPMGVKKVYFIQTTVSGLAPAAGSRQLPQ